jgi:hypothetical protein
MSPSDYAKNSDWAHKRLLEALGEAAAERDMTLPAEVELFTEDAPMSRHQSDVRLMSPIDSDVTDSFWTAIGGHDPDLMLILATALAEPH